MNDSCTATSLPVDLGGAVARNSSFSRLSNSSVDTLPMRAWSKKILTSQLLVKGGWVGTAHRSPILVKFFPIPPHH